jgi:hypothetical protein
MGPDGTDDNVKIKICSDDNTVCSESDKLSHLLKSEWVKDKKETWKAKEFGKCKDQVFPLAPPVIDHLFQQNPPVIDDLFQQKTRKLTKSL